MSLGVYLSSGSEVNRPIKIAVFNILQIPLHAELYILPYWGDPIGADSIYGFNREPLQSFSYETAVKNSKLAKKIAELLNSDYLYGAPDFSPYTITKDLIEQHMELSSQFDEIWSMVYMMQCLEMISVDEILDDEQGRVYFALAH